MMMYKIMLQKRYKYLCLILLLSCSHNIYSANDSSKISISITIKGSQQKCNYDYSSDGQSDLSKYHTSLSTCAINQAELQHHLDQFISSKKDVSIFKSNSKKERVFITVQ